MGFPPNVAEKALLSCQRSCSICHKFCGTKIELHHIKPSCEGGEDIFENCIPLCFDCHADARTYNPKHPKGKKYTESELRRHRDVWYAKVEKGEVNFETDKAGAVSDSSIEKRFKIIPKMNTFRPHAFLGDGRVDMRTHFTVDLDFINNHDEITLLYRPEIISFKPNSDLLNDNIAAVQFKHFPDRIDFWTFPYKFKRYSRDLMRCEIDVNLTNNNLTFFSNKLDSLNTYEIEFHFTYEDMDATKTIEEHKICGTYDDFKEEVRNFWKGKNIFQTNI